MGFFSNTPKPAEEPVKFKYFKAPTTTKAAKPKAKKVVKKAVKKVAKKKK